MMGELPVSLLVALLGGGLVSALADFLRARREGKAAPAQLENVVASGAQAAVASLRDALAEANSRADRLEQTQRDLRTELTDVRRRCDDQGNQLGEARAHNAELERALVAARDRIRLLEATVHTLQGSAPPAPPAGA